MHDLSLNSSSLFRRTDFLALCKQAKNCKPPYRKENSFLFFNTWLYKSFLKVIKLPTRSCQRWQLSITYTMRWLKQFLFFSEFFNCIIIKIFYTCFLKHFVKSNLAIKCYCDFIKYVPHCDLICLCGHTCAMIFLTK